MADLQGKVEVNFDAQASLTYKRSIKAKGSIVLHTTGFAERPTAEMAGFDYIDTQQFTDEPAGKLSVEVDATVKLSIIPSIYIGLFAEAGVGALSGEATAHVAGVAELIAQARFQLGTSVATDGTKTSLVPAVTTCDAALLGCSEEAVCNSTHDLQLHLQAIANFSLMYKLYARVSFGNWRRAFCLKFGDGNQELTTEEQTAQCDTPRTMTALPPWVKDLSYHCWNLPGFSASRLPSTSPSPPPPNPPGIKTSPSPPPGPSPPPPPPQPNCQCSGLNCQIWGCTYPSAANYAPGAELDDGSCVFDCVADSSGICDATDLCTGQTGGHCRRLFSMESIETSESSSTIMEGPVVISVAVAGVVSVLAIGAVLYVLVRRRRKLSLRKFSIEAGGDVELPALPPPKMPDFEAAPQI